MIEDFVRNHSNDLAVNEALHDIDKLLQEKGSSCAILGLPLPQGECRSDDETTQLEPAPSFDELNEEQQCLVEAVLQSIESVGRGDEPVSM